MVQQGVLQHCDLSGDGMLPPDALADSIAESIKTKLAQRGF